MNALRHIIWTTNAAGDAGECEGWLSYTGQSVAEIHSLGWAEAIHPEDRLTAIDRWQQAVAARQPFEAEYRLRRHDGQYRVFLSRGLPILNHDGSIREWQGFSTDISHRKAAEQATQRATETSEALRRSLVAINACEDLCSALQCLLCQTIQLAGMDGGAVYLVEGAEAVLQHHQNLPPEFIQLVARRSLTTGYIQAAFTKPGEVLHISEYFPENHRTSAAYGLQHVYTLALLSETEPFGFMNLASRAAHPPDASAIALIRILALETECTFKRLRATQRLHSVLTTMADGVVLHGPDGRIIDCNPGAERILGLTRDEVLGRKSADPRWRAIHEDGTEFPGSEHLAMITLRTGEPCRERIMGICQPEGARKWISINTEPLATNRGLQGVVASFSDITRQRQLEAVLRQSQKMQGIGQLAGGMAHELNNILAAMVLNLEIARGITPDPEVRGHIADVNGLAGRATALIRQLLAFSRKSTANLEPLDLAAELSRQLKMVQALLGDKIELKFVNTAPSAWVRGDQNLLSQVLVNLCLNARDAMRAGGSLLLKLTAQPADADCAGGIPTPQYDPMVCVAMTDTGCGMKPDTLKRVFEPFFTTKEVGQGMGLGLATAHGIVEQHRGRISATSEWGQGSTFRICLPALPAPAAPQETQMKGCTTILVMDNEPSVLTMTELLLIRQGYSVLLAANGREAMEQWRDHAAQIKLIIADLVLPGDMSGLQMVEQALAERPGMKAIITSGYAPELADLRRALESNLLFLPKPCPPATLTACIRQCLAPAGTTAG